MRTATHVSSAPGSESPRHCPHGIHYASYSSLNFRRYLPGENRFAVRNENPLPVRVLGQRRYDFAQGQQGLVDAHALLRTGQKHAPTSNLLTMNFPGRTSSLRDYCIDTFLHKLPTSLGRKIHSRSLKSQYNQKSRTLS